SLTPPSPLQSTRNTSSGSAPETIDSSSDSSHATTANSTDSSTIDLAASLETVAAQFTQLAINYWKQHLANLPDLTVQLRVDELDGTELGEAILGNTAPGT